MIVPETEGYVDLGIGAQWKAGTKTYTLTDLFMQWGNGRWVVRVMFEIKWKKRRRYETDNWGNFVALLQQENATLIVQEGKVENQR